MARLTPYSLLLPSGVFLLAFTYWSVVQVIRGSLTVKGFRGVAHWGLGNYQRLFADHHFSIAVSSNLVYAVSETNWLGDPSLALGSIIAPTIWKNCGYYMLFFLAGLAGLAGIPQDLLDAAKIDGAGPLQRFYRITLPLLGPTLAFVLVIAGLNAPTQVDHVIVLTQGGPSDATAMILFHIYQQAQQNFDVGMASAATVVSVGLLFALSVVSLLTAAAVLWFVPFAWMAVASIRHNSAGAADLASLIPAGPFSLENFADAWSSGDFPLWYLNTFLVCGGILLVQCVTVSLAGYAFARLRFAGRDTLFAMFLLQLMLVPPILIVPNLSTLVALHLYDTLPGIMAPYCASAFGVFLMRPTFRTIPREYEEAALVDGASRIEIIIHVLLPLSRPGLTAFAIVSVTSHWNEFLWPLMATSSPANQVLTVGLASFTAGAAAGSEWGVIAAGTCLVAAPLLIAFVIFQRRFVSSFTFAGIK